MTIDHDGAMSTLDRMNQKDSIGQSAVLNKEKKLGSHPPKYNGGFQLSLTEVLNKEDWSILPTVQIEKSTRNYIHMRNLL